MKIQTFSVVVGTEACNARCPFCISKQTTDAGVPSRPIISLPEEQRISRNFKKACRLAQLCGCTTVLFTGKGEPTLFPKEITGYLNLMREYDFPRIELQTNGMQLCNPEDKFNAPPEYLHEWYDRGLTTIAISMVHWKDEVNKSVYAPHRGWFYNLESLTKMLHDLGFFVRWSVTMLGGYIDSAEGVFDMAMAAKQNRVEQLTFRPVMAIEQKSTHDIVVADWVEKHAVKQENIAHLKEWLDSKTKLMTLSHGATVYDIQGQNVCLTDCMTSCPNSDDIRTLIFFPNGQTRYDWRYEGAIL